VEAEVEAAGPVRVTPLSPGALFSAQ
jgi:hypothetical protein